MIALGYCLVYGVLRLINFAHGDIFMVASYLGYFLIAFLFTYIFVGGGVSGWLILAITLPVVMFFTSLLGVFIERVAYSRYGKKVRIDCMLLLLH